MSSTRFNAQLNTSHDRMPHPLKDGGVVAYSLTGIPNGMVKCLFVVNRSCIHKEILHVPIGKYPVGSNVSVEASSGSSSNYHNRSY
jgi:hypothetical protein